MKRALFSFLIRWHASVERPLPRWIGRICERDTRLRKELASEETLSGQLRDASVKGSEPSVPRGSLERALAAIDRQKRAAQPAERRNSVGGWQWLSLAAAGLAAVVLLAVFWQDETSPENGDGLARQASPARVDIAAVANLDLGVERLLDADWKNPLDQEFEYLLADGKRAVDFVIGNFTPEKKQGS